MPSRISRDTLLGFGELAIDTLVILSYVVEQTNRKNIFASFTASKAILSLFTKVVSGSLSPEAAITKMDFIASCIE